MNTPGQNLRQVSKWGDRVQHTEIDEKWMEIIYMNAFLFEPRYLAPCEVELVVKAGLA